MKKRRDFITPQRCRRAYLILFGHINKAKRKSPRRINNTFSFIFIENVIKCYERRYRWVQNPRWRRLSSNTFFVRGIKSLWSTRIDSDFFGVRLWLTVINGWNNYYCDCDFMITAKQHSTNYCGWCWSGQQHTQHTPNVSTDWIETNNYFELHRSTVRSWIFWMSWWRRVFHTENVSRFCWNYQFVWIGGCV